MNDTDKIELDILRTIRVYQKEHRMQLAQSNIFEALLWEYCTTKKPIPEKKLYEKVYGYVPEWVDLVNVRVHISAMKKRYSNKFKINRTPNGYMLEMF